MADVVVLGGFTKLDIPVERVLDGAKDLESVLVLGWTKSGQLYAASSMGGDGMRAIELAMRFQHKYLDGGYG